MLLLYILWDDWPIFMISGSNKQLQQELEYPTKAWLSQLVFSKMQSDTSEEWYAIKFYFKLRNVTETYGKLQTAFRPSCMNRASVFEWHWRFKEAGSLCGIMRGFGRSKEVNTQELIGKTVRVTMLKVLRKFRNRLRRKRPALLKSGQWHFHQDNTPVHNSIHCHRLFDKIGIKTVPHRPYIPDLSPCDFWLFRKLRTCRYETIEEMKEGVAKVIDTHIQEDFQRVFKKLLERYNKCIAAGGDYFEGNKSFMCVLSIKEPIRKKSGNLFNDPRK